jgi:hypothetical protein
MLPPLTHHILSFKRRQPTNEHGSSPAFDASHHIEAPVDSVDPVDVRPPRRTEHHGVARCNPGFCGCMGRWIFRSLVGLNFNDDPSCASPAHRRHQSTPKQISRDLQGGPGQKVSGE